MEICVLCRLDRGGDALLLNSLQWDSVFKG